jgi:hypothetical protein
MKGYKVALILLILNRAKLELHVITERICLYQHYLWSVRSYPAVMGI